MKYYFDITPSKNFKKLDDFLLKTKKEFSLFFCITTEEPNIFFLHSRKEIDVIFGRKTESWLCAWATDSNIYTLHPNVYTTESNHNADHFWPVIKHEYAHLFFKQLTGVSYPKWLNEGLACYLAKQEKKAPTHNEAMKILDSFQKSNSQIYSIGYFWVKLLIERFGKKKFMKFLKRISPRMDEKKFDKAFYATYKIRFNKKELNILFQENACDQKCRNERGRSRAQEGA